jgi:hypothetical protein
VVAKSLFGDSGLYPEAARFLARHAGGAEDQVRPQLAAPLEEIAVVELVEVVGAQHQEGIRVELADQRAVAVDGVGVALGEPALLLLAVLVLEGGEHLEAAVGAVEVPGAAVGQVLVDRVQLVLLDDPDV